MGDSGTGSSALRIERGRATDEELAAVTVVLISILAAQAEGEEGTQGESSGAPQWRPERSVAGYRSPYSWQ
ncbi:acyl-CoA carboxylase subunit epsilon [Streptomyces sp. NPDC054794]